MNKPRVSPGRQWSVVFASLLPILEAGAKTSPRVISNPVKTEVPTVSDVMVESAAEVSPMSLEMEARYSWSTALQDHKNVNVAESHFDLNLTGERRISDSWIFQWSGIEDINKFEHASPDMPDMLQYFAANLAVQYRVKSAVLFDLEIQPGWYSGENISEGTFNAPITLVGALPLSDRFALTGGIYYLALTDGNNLFPLGGLVAEINPQWEVNLTYPELSVTYSPDEKQSLRFQTEELINTYRTPVSGKSPMSVQYTQLRAGVTYERKFDNDWSIAFTAGWTFEKELHFTDTHQTLKLDPAPFVQLHFLKFF